jgi:uncharacterized protein
MTIGEYSWSAADQFIGRADDLARLDMWWNRPGAEPINLYGRRRVGKSWLFRRLAHGKRAVLLVAERTTPAQQLAKLAEQLEPHLTFRPEIRDVGTLFKILYQLASTEKLLVVVDEFPYLWGTSPSDISDTLSSVQAAMEQFRDDSKIKLILCGSAVTQMESLQSERSPLHGRLQPFELRPLDFPEARAFMPALTPIEQFTRFSVAGGMPRYLSTLCAGSPGTFAAVLAREVVDRNSPLFNEPLAVLQAEVREPAVYLAILDALASNPADLGALSAKTGTEGSRLSPYLEKLEVMGLIRRRSPVGAGPKARSGQFYCDDDFIRFWFRFVHPYQADLEAGSDATSHAKRHVLPYLTEHTSLSFENAFRRWVRQEYGEAGQVGAWWGPALNAQRRAKLRFTEEVDAVGVKHKSVVVVGEAKWTNKLMPLDVLTDLLKYKVPAMEQAGFRLPADGLQIVLASRSGFTAALESSAHDDPRIALVTAERLLQDVD